MHPTTLAYAVPLLLVSLANAALGWHAWRRRAGVPGAGSLALLMGAAAVWSLGGVARLLAIDTAGLLVAIRAGYPGLLLAGPAWLLFTVRLTGGGHRHRALLLGALFLLPAISLGLVWTDPPEGGLYWSRLLLEQHEGRPTFQGVPGPWYWLQITQVYACLGGGMLVLLRRAAIPGYRRQVAVLVAGVAAPWATHLAYLAGFRLLQQDPTPFALLVSGAAFSLAVFRLRLLELVPVARGSLVEAMRDGMLVVDPAGRVVDANPAARSMLGEGLVGRPVEDVFARWPEVLARFTSVLETEQEISLGERSYEVRISPLGDASSLAGRLVVWHEVTARRALEARLSGQRELLEGLLEIARATAEQPALEQTLRNTLEVAATLTGAESASLVLLGEQGAIVHHLVARHHSTVEYPRSFIDRVMGEGLGGWVARERMAVLLPDAPADPRWILMPGEPPWRSVICAPIASSERLVGILTLTHLQPGAFVAHHLDLIRAAAGQMALALANAQLFEARSRMAARQEILYGVLRAVGGHRSPREAARTAVEVIAQRTAWSHVIVALPHPDGLHWHFEVSSRPAFPIESMPLQAGVIGRAHREGRTQRVDDVRADPDYVDALGGARSELAIPIRRGERALGVLDVESDVLAGFGAEDLALAESLADALALALDSARLYEELARKHERLRDVERMRDDLTHSMVHDLKNPLTTISAVVEGLDMALSPEAAREHRLLELAMRGIKKMAVLLDAILDLSRLESGQMPLVRARIRLSTLVEDVLRLQAPLAEGKAITLEADLPAEPADAWADPALTARVLQNLVGNALKFTPRGGRVRVHAERAAGEVRLTISDNGPGIAPEVREHLFQKFATAGPGQGSGLGLAFCRLAVEAQGGRIWVDRDQETGATFTFTLPLAA